MRGPGNWPELIASRISTVLNPPRESMSSTVVKPASRSTCAFASAISARLAGGLGWLRFRWTCPSIIPGSTVAAPRSITVAPAGTCTPAPASAMRLPLTTTTGLASILPDRASNSRAPRIATTWLGGARNFRASGDAEGVLAVPAAPSPSCERTAALAAAATATKTTTNLFRLRMAPPLSRAAANRKPATILRVPLVPCLQRPSHRLVALAVDAQVSAAHARVRAHLGHVRRRVEPELHVVHVLHQLGGELRVQVAGLALHHLGAVHAVHDGFDLGERGRTVAFQRDRSDVRVFALRVIGVERGLARDAVLGHGGRFQLAVAHAQIGGRRPLQEAQLAGREGHDDQEHDHDDEPFDDEHERISYSLTRWMSVISEGIPNRIGGPQYPVPRLV